MRIRLDKVVLANVLIPVAFMGFGIYVLSASRGLPAPPAQFPRVFAVLLIILSLGFAVVSAWRHIATSRDRSTDDNTSHAATKARANLVILSLLYSISIIQFGFYLSTVFWLAVMIASLGYRRHGTVVTLALMSGAALYALFRLLLEVPTPIGEIFGF